MIHKWSLFLIGITLTILFFAIADNTNETEKISNQSLID